MNTIGLQHHRQFYIDQWLGEFLGFGIFLETVEGDGKLKTRCGGRRGKASGNFSDDSKRA